MTGAQAKEGRPDLPVADFDYLDCVESAEGIGELRDPTTWLGEAFSAMPRWVVAVRRAVLKPGEWEVVSRNSELTQMVQPTSIGMVAIAARTVDGRRRMTTGIRFASRVGRCVWAVIGPIHRKSARAVVAG